MNNEHDKLCFLFGIIIAVAWAVGPAGSLWSTSRLIPAIVFGIALIHSSIKRLTPLTHGIVNWLMLPLLLCLVALAVSEGGALRITITALCSLIAFLILHRIATLRIQDGTLRDSKATEAR